MRFDDGKANALGHQAIDAFHSALDEAEATASAVAIFGRPGRFSAGFDLNVMKQGPESAQALVRRGAELLMRLYGFPMPVVAGCTGHALAAGALILLSCDERIGIDGETRIGLPEVSIGMPLPRFATELARDRLTNRQFTKAALLSASYSPTAAVEAGFLDEIVADDLDETVIKRATELGANLSKDGFRITRQNARGKMIAGVLAELDADVATFSVSGN